MSSALAFEWPTPTLRIVGMDVRFPVRRIYCIGRNYAAHAREMGKDPDREPPFFFMKPASALVAVNEAEEGQLAYPSHTQDFQHEIELIAAMGARAASVTPEEALRHVYGYAVGLDMTRRDLLLTARDAGRPWEPGKAFSPSAPVGPIRRVVTIGHPFNGRIWLNVNGQPRQNGDLAELIWSVAECISYLSALDPLEPGDLVFTGTPQGVGAVRPGDELHGGIERVGEIRVRIDVSATEVGAR